PAPVPESSRSAAGSAMWGWSTSSVLRIGRPGGNESVQGSVDARGKCGVDAFHPRNLLLAGGLEPGQATEMTQQRATPARADAGDVLQPAGGARLLTAPAVAGDGKPVRFIPHLLDELQPQ